MSIARSLILPLWAPFALALAVGCNGDSPTFADGGAPPVDGSPGQEQVASGDGSAQRDSAFDGPPPVCQLGSSSCLSETRQRICREVGGQLDWAEEDCPAQTLCLGTTCSAACGDECRLDQTREVGGQTQQCKPFSVAKGDFVEAIPEGMSLRARKHHAWIRKHHLPGGTISDLMFTDTQYTRVSAYVGTGDSAIWTGSYLAAEALRLMTTGSDEAEASVESLVEAIHRLFEVTGHRGYHARYTAPLDDGDARIRAIYQPDDLSHHVSDYKGRQYFWNGNTSRDQNSGVVMGYGVAYRALRSEAHKEMIRQDMVGMCGELMKERQQMLVSIRVHALGKWNEFDVPMNLEHVVLNPSEFKDGKPWIQFGTDDDPNDYESSQMRGIREYWPDFSLPLRQIPLVNLLPIPPIPRSGTAVMLSSMFRVCIDVTAGQSQYATEHAAFKQHYAQNIASWLEVMKLYIFFNAAKCWDKYYGLNIVWEPIYNLLTLEDDANLRASFQRDVVQAKLWELAKEHKNVFFSYIWASQAPTPQQAMVDGANAQLAQFPAPPHIERHVDNTKLLVDGHPKYQEDLPNCPNNATVAIDVGDRRAGDFIWQRNPFVLRHTGRPLHVYPGSDYLLPYWMGRYHGFLQDDAQGVCLRWAP